MSGVGRRQITRIGEKMPANESYLLGSAIGVFVIGAVLSYFGYTAL